MKRRIWTVAVAVRVEVDPDAWSHEFHVPMSEVRADVKSYLAGLCETQLQELGLGR